VIESVECALCFLIENKYMLKTNDTIMRRHTHLSFLLFTD
jgi:hypothetical protein